jgi:hypothetical protein
MERGHDTHPCALDRRAFIQAAAAAGALLAWPGEAWAKGGAAPGVLSAPGGRDWLLYPAHALVFGRGKGSHVSITHGRGAGASCQVSRTHFALKYDGAKVTLHDEGSSNGTFLGVGARKKRITGATTLRDGDVVTAGEGVALKVELGRRASARVGKGRAALRADAPGALAYVALTPTSGEGPRLVMVCHEVGLRRAGSSLGLTGDVDAAPAALLVSRGGVELSRRAAASVSVDGVEVPEATTRRLAGKAALDLEGVRLSYLPAASARRLRDAVGPRSDAHTFCGTPEYRKGGE